jgi:hypothetical protein
MQNKNTQGAFMSYFQLTTALGMALVLTACGGGGGSSPAGGGSNGATSGVSVTPSVPAFQASTIVNTVFIHSSTEPEVQSAFTRLNAERSQCGFGTLRQSTTLDMAAQNHADWQNLNNYSSHSEVPGTLGYTGANPLERTTYAGYAGVDVLEGLTRYVGRTSKAGLGEGELRDLFLAPYHMLALLRGSRNVGVAIRNSVDVNASVSGVVTELEFGYLPADGKQLPSTTDVLTYPCEGVTGTRYRLIGESPQVEANRNYITNPSGQPIFIMVREGNLLVVASFSLTDVGSGTPVMVKPLTFGNDRNASIRSNEVILIPDTPLGSLKQYAVTISGTNAGVTFSRSFTFTTGL